MNVQRKWFLVMVSTGEDTESIVEVTTKYLEYQIIFLDEVMAGFERTDSNFEISSTIGKLLSNSITCYRETFCERKSVKAAHFLVVLS
jgi:hypothetical protein